MKTIKTIFGTAICAVMLISANASVAEAGYRSPVYLLKLRYEQRREALHDAYRTQREQLEYVKRNALAEWRIARAQAVELCEPDRSIALRQLAGQRREIIIRHRADLGNARNQYELRNERLKRWYDIQRRQLAWQTDIAGPAICSHGPSCSSCGVPGPALPRPPTPSYEYQYEYQQRRSTAPRTEVIVPDVTVPGQPLFNLEETGSYSRRHSLWNEMAVRLGRMGFRGF